MSDATANQLRLVRDACARLEGDAGNSAAIATVLAELIAGEALPPATGNVGEEKAWLRSFETLAEKERTARASGGVEALDHDALAGFIATAIPGEAVKIVSSNTVSRGMSKKTVLVTLAGNKTLPTNIALRIDRTANNYLGTTVLDEMPLLELLWAHGARIPQPFVLEPTGEVIGDPFIIFASATGVPVGGNYVLPPRGAELIADVASCLAKIHAVPVDNWPRPDQPQGPAHFDKEFDDYLNDWHDLGETSAIMEACFDWVQVNRALAYGPPSFVHNDYNFNNMLIEDKMVSAVLDWEFGHVGTAAADLGYFWYAAEGGSSFAEFLTAYQAAGGCNPPKEQIDFYILWGQLRLAVMGFMAVRNLEQGLFDDVRYGMSRWHRRQGLLRVSSLLEMLENGGIT